MNKRRIEVWDDGAWAITEIKALMPGQLIRMFETDADFSQVGACEWVVEGYPMLIDGIWGVRAKPAVYDNKVLLTEINI